VLGRVAEAQALHDPRDDPPEHWRRDGLAQLPNPLSLVAEHDVGAGQGHPSLDLVWLQHPEEAVLDLDDWTLCQTVPVVAGEGQHRLAARCGELVR
jgi:hypothetical protein